MSTQPNNSAGSRANGQNFGGSGGGIYIISNSGNVIINNSRISNNFAGSDAGAVFGGSVTVTITNSTINGNTAVSAGGGIIISKNFFNNPNSLTNSSVTNNKSMFSNGGGIINNGIFNIINSTISDNSAGDDGGGINNSTVGKITLNNSTISGNRAGIDGSGDGGGIRNNNFSGNSINISNTIIADNSWGDSAYGVIPNDFRGYLNSLGFNLIETVGGNSIFGDTTTNITGQDPMLDPILRNNGGPTLTHALLPGSPAINTGDNTNAPTTDQRGFARIVGGTIDIGAYEFVPSKSRKRIRLIF